MQTQQRVRHAASSTAAKIYTRYQPEKTLDCASRTGGGNRNTGWRYPRTKQMGNAGDGTPGANIAQMARYSRVAPQLGDRHQN
jgi:hypothetical protein